MIGEIALVVIGILIALQINRWNEERMVIERERDIASEIYEELEQNKNYSFGLSIKFDRRQDAIDSILILTATANPAISEQGFNSLLADAIGFSVYAPIKSKLNGILSLSLFITFFVDMLLCITGVVVADAWIFAI